MNVFWGFSKSSQLYLWLPLFHSIKQSKSKITCKMLQDTAQSRITVLTQVSLLKTWNLKWGTYTDMWAVEQSWWYSQALNAQRSPSSKTSIDQQLSASIRLLPAKGPKHQVMLEVLTKKTEWSHGWNCIIFLWVNIGISVFREDFYLQAKNHLGRRIKHLFHFLF